jgi:predicted RNA binding protein YcfA (HicA-like mRNA interferase family)
MMVKEVKLRDVERFLESSGWHLARTTGGHNVWKSPDGIQTLAIPRHGTVTKGVVRQVVRILPAAPDGWK